MAVNFNSNTDELVVVKIGGVALEQQYDFIDEIRTLYTQYPIVLVHGGGKLVSQWLGKLNIVPEFVNGLRKTDLATLEVVSAILGGIININITATLKNMGVNAIGLCGVTIMHGSVEDDELGYVSETAQMSPDVQKLFSGLDGMLPVISPLVANDNQDAGEPAVLNMNADSFAGHLAKYLNASKLVFITDMEGVLDGNKRRIPHITIGQAAELVETGVAAGGMIPKIRACLTALEFNPEMDTHIIGGDKSGLLTDAIQGRKVGTNIYRPKV